MKKLRQYKISYNQEIIDGKVSKMNSELSIASVNSSYHYSNTKGGVKKNQSVSEYQNYLKDRFINQSDRKPVISTPVILHITVNALGNLKKDGTINKTYQKDVDNFLKSIIDSSEGIVIRNDNIVYGIIAEINYNVTKNPEILFSVYDYNKKTFKEYIDKISIKSFFKEEIFMESGISPVSFNNMYEYAIPQIVQVLQKLNIKQKNSLKSKIISNFRAAIGELSTYSKEILGYKMGLLSKTDMWILKQHLTEGLPLPLKKRKVLTKKARDYKRYMFKEFKTRYKGKIVENDLFCVYKFNIRREGERDLDNLIKATQDSLSGSVIKDDVQIKKIFAIKEKVDVGPESVEVLVSNFKNN